MSLFSFLPRHYLGKRQIEIHPLSFTPFNAMGQPILAFACPFSVINGTLAANIKTWRPVLADCKSMVRLATFEKLMRPQNSAVWFQRRKVWS